MTDDAYDRLESLGEARELNGEPEPWDDEYWDGVLYDAVLPPERTEVAA
jgi:hypothetical protein